MARWAFTLSQYDNTIEYRKTGEHGNADFLSRLLIGPDTKFDDGDEVKDINRVCLIRSIGTQLTPTQPGVVKNETDSFKIQRYIREGFLPRPDNDEPELRHFRKLENTLTVDNGCVFNGSRIVIPEALRRQVLHLLHLGHVGMQRMKQLARSAVYWPHIDENIADLLRGCTSCVEHQNAPEKAPIHPWILPEKPWSRIHVDHVINFMDSNWLIVTDAYSKYPCIHSIQSIASKATMLHLEHDFANFGYPHTIVSDNATTFTSENFKSSVMRGEFIILLEHLIILLPRYQQEGWQNLSSSR